MDLDPFGWETMQRVKRDICFLYHELGRYTGIFGDLEFGSGYSLPYWACLDDSQLATTEDAEFIRDGCLVMILAMAWDLLDGSGTYLRPYLGECRSAVGRVALETNRTAKLVRTVMAALDAAAGNQRPTPELEQLSVWVNFEYVYGYFQSTAEALGAAHAEHGYRSDPSLATG